MQKLKVPNQEKHPNEFLNPELVIAPMRLQDLDEVLRIEQASFGSPWSRNQFQDEIQRNPLSHPVIVRKKGKGIIGYCVCWIVAAELHINNLAVDPEERKSGCGEIMMRWVLQFGAMALCRNATLEVRTTNAPAIRLYEKLGFHKLGVAPAYYEDNGDDAYILVKKLGTRESQTRKDLMTGP